MRPSFAPSRSATATSGRSISTSPEQPFACRECGLPTEPGERFCSHCGALLAAAPAGAEEPRDERTRRARKIDPRFTAGELRRVAVGHNQPEAELMQGILLEEGIPSILRRSGGFDVPDFLAAGPRDILVPASAEAEARRLLGTEGGN